MINLKDVKVIIEAEDEYKTYSWINKEFPNREELAWAGGFFDGEGYIGVINDRGYQRINISIGNTYEETLLRFNHAINYLGVINGPYDRGFKPQWAMRVNGWVKTQAVIAMIGSFLSGEKRNQAYNALWRPTKI